MLKQYISFVEISKVVFDLLPLIAICIHRGQKINKVEIMTSSKIAPDFGCVAFSKSGNHWLH